MSDELVQELKRWGLATVSRFARMEDGPSRGDSVMAKAPDFAPGTRERAERQLIGRDGRSRRLYMAGKIKCGVRSVPIWSCDPVPARNDADRPHDNPAALVDLGLPDDLLWVDALIRGLERQHQVRGMIVREEYTGAGTQAMKVRRVELAYGGKLSLRQYRYELQRAMDWMRGRREAA